jgi:hypothetical protein
MIFNERVGKLKIVQNIAKYFFQFVINVEIYLLWAHQVKTIEYLEF